MITYQLANGKTIRLTDEQYWKMTDQDFKDLEGSNYGSTINDPFYDSILKDEHFDLVESIDTELPEIQDFDIDYEGEEE